MYLQCFQGIGSKINVTLRAAVVLQNAAYIDRDENHFIKGERPWPFIKKSMENRAPYERMLHLEKNSKPNLNFLAFFQ